MTSGVSQFASATAATIRSRSTLSAGSTPQAYRSSGNLASPTSYPVYDPSYVYEGSSQTPSQTNSNSARTSPRPSPTSGIDDKDSQSLEYYESSGATALSHLPAPYPTSSMVPVFTPDTLGPAYGGGYWGVPLTYVSSDSVPTGSSASGIPIGYTATGGPYTPIPTIPGASSSLAEATESLYQSLCANGDPACQPVTDPLPTETGSSYATSGLTRQGDSDSLTASPSDPYPSFTTVTGPGYTSVYSLAYASDTTCYPDPTGSVLVYASGVASASSGAGSSGYGLPAKDLPKGGSSKNSTNLAARTAPPGYSESKGHRVVYASSLVAVGMLAVLLIL